MCFLGHFKSDKDSFRKSSRPILMTLAQAFSLTKVKKNHIQSKLRQSVTAQHMQLQFSRNLVTIPSVAKNTSGLLYEGRRQTSRWKITSIIGNNLNYFSENQLRTGQI